ncbi:Gametogenetin-binding protein 2 [Plasmopara halstedii]|uniref:Gametogenetin-binding protein 2 n=1 Tax=Plasmopara halstedii TaxID=4781 RepID=A0A0P1B7A1_PLAHL|nr:Gametogenetin-binding protein 2 [Plasmopara halstedii]CEG49574.1 Gametogenetin-binding protein 2 [Plasmopara halstedii]|eukprot:XP_024585943.1 Gametogenetin-binding protein 2 [Plasmopara halstedii]
MPSAAEMREFHKRWLLLTDQERIEALKGNANQLLQTARDLLSCPGCRNGTEALFYKMVDGNVRIPPLISQSGLCFSKDQCFQLNDSYMNSPDTSFSLFHHQKQWVNSALVKPNRTQSKSGTSRARCQLHSQRERGHPRPAAFVALWHKLSEDHQRHLSHIDSDQFLTDLESYLRRHRFCCRCKEKVLEAYDLLIGTSCSEDDCEDCGVFECSERHHEHCDYTDELNYTSYLFDELAFSSATNQIIVPCSIKFMSQLMSRADQELVGDWGDRHARTITEAQDEVLVCLGMVIWDKIQSLWTKLQSDKLSEELLAHCAVLTLRRNFDVAVEALHASLQSLMKNRKQSSSGTTMTSQSSTNSLSSQGEEDERSISRKSIDLTRLHQFDQTCDKRFVQGNLMHDERLEWQLLSSMGWNASDPSSSFSPEHGVDTDDENYGISEDDIRFWKQNQSSLVRRRMAQRQKVQERFNQFVLRTTSLNA